MDFFPAERRANWRRNMSQSNVATNGDIQEEQLNRAIEELRGVLHDEKGAPQRRIGGRRCRATTA